VLLLQVSHLGHQELRHVGRRAHGEAILRRDEQHAAAQFQRRFDLRRLGLAQSLFRLQLGKAGAGQARQAVVLGNEARRQGQDVLAAQPRAQDDGQQFRRRKRPLARPRQPLARALVDRHVLDRRPVLGGLLSFLHATNYTQVARGCQISLAQRPLLE
jgi:hypothetical protein